MNWKKFKWQVRDALGQIDLATKQTADMIVSLFTFNMRGYEERCDRELDAFIAKRDAERP